MKVLRIKYFFAYVFLILNLSFNTYANISSDNVNEKDLISLINKIPTPPKNIEDVIKLLDNTKSDLTVIEKYKQLANSNPDSNFNNNQLFQSQ